MSSKQIKKLRSNVEKHKMIIGIVVVVVAVMLASTSQIQTGFIASENGFTVPFPDGEAKIGENSTIDLIWSTNTSLEDLGFEYYEIWVNINGAGFEYEERFDVSGTSVVYTVNGADYGPKNTVVIRMMLYSPVGEDASENMEYDITWDDVTILILEDPTIDDPEPTTTTTTGIPEPPLPAPYIVTNQELFIYILYGVGGMASIMAIGAILVRKKRG